MTEARPESAPPRVAKALTVAGVGLALALAAWARVILLGRVFGHGDVVPTDNDSAYHLRRALLTLERFPHVPTWDRFLAWPRGGAATWAPGYDQLLALPAWIAGATHHRALAIMAWVPFALGLASVALTAWLASRVESDPDRRPAVTVTAAVVCAMVPASAAVSQVGGTDHHVFETLYVAALALWLTAVTTRHASVRRAVATELVGAFVLALGVHTFTGTVLYAGLAAAGLCAHHLVDREPVSARGVLPSGALAYVLSALAVVVVDHGFIRAFGHPWHHLALSYLQPLLLAVASVALAAFGHARARADSLPRRALIALALGIVPVALLALALPHARHEVTLALVQWLGRRSAYMADIDECSPLFTAAPFTVDAWAQARSKLGLLAPLSLVATPLAALRAWRSLGPRSLPLGALFAGLALLSLQQNRFTRAITPALAVVVALALVDLLRRAPPLRAWPRLLGSALALTLAWVALDPALRPFTHAEPPPDILGLTAQARFIRSHMPPPVLGHRSAVLTSWAGGNEVMLVGERPALVSSFGPYVSPDLYAEVDAVWRRDEPYLLSVLDRRDAGAVAITSADLLTIALPGGVRALRVGRNGGVVLDRRWMERVPLGAMLMGGSGIVEARVRHLEHLMPVFAEDARAPYLSFPLPRGWVFDRVAGAVIEGDTDGPATVVATVPVTFRGNPRSWVAWTISPGGRWRLTVPVPTGYAGGGITTAPAFTITVNGRPVGEVRVTEADVRQGRAVTVAPR